MSDGSTADSAWFAEVEPGDTEAAATAIRERSAPAPQEWPELALDDVRPEIDRVAALHIGRNPVLCLHGREVFGDRDIEFSTEVGLEVLRVGHTAVTLWSLILCGVIGWNRLVDRPAVGCCPVHTAGNMAGGHGRTYCQHCPP